jgi:hypothetical protein
VTTLEQELRVRWKANAARLHYGACEDCGRTRDDDGRPLLVARQERGRRFQCLECFDRRPTGAAARRAA